MRMRLKQVVRSLARMPGFTAVSVLTLAIGIGANTAVFGVIQAPLEPLPFPTRTSWSRSTTPHPASYRERGRRAVPVLPLP